MSKAQKADESVKHERVLHCWEDKRYYMIETFGWGSPEHLETYGEWDGPDVNATCMLEADHEGDHEWTPDSEIGIRFVADSGEEAL